MKALGLRPRAFICFSVFGTRDKALALVFDILRNRWLLPFEPVDEMVKVMSFNQGLLTVFPYSLSNKVCCEIIGPRLFC